MLPPGALLPPLDRRAHSKCESKQRGKRDLAQFSTPRSFVARLRPFIGFFLRALAVSFLSRDISNLSFHLDRTRDHLRNSSCTLSGASRVDVSVLNNWMFEFPSERGSMLRLRYAETG